MNRFQAFLLMLSVATPSAAVAPKTYDFEIIPTFEEPSDETLGLALAINELGEVVGISDDATLTARGFLYRNGRLTEVPGFDPGTTSHPMAINQFGDVAGGAGQRVSFMGQPAIVTMPFVQDSGRGLRNLLTPEEIGQGNGGFALSLNDSGVVAFDPPALWLPGNQRLYWGFPDGGVIDTGTINDLGQVVGTGIRQGGTGFEALVYDLRDGSLIPLHDPAIASASFAVVVNNQGVAVGEWILVENNRTVPVSWEDGRARQLPFLHEDQPGWIGRTTAINDRGDILGESVHGSGVRVDWVLFAGESVPVALLDLVGNEFFEGFDDFLALDLNNSREIAGAAIRRDPTVSLGSTNKPAVLRPRVPQVPAFPAPGLWADLDAAGSGVEINRVGSRHYLIWYTYDSSGLPTWYFSDTVVMDRDGWRADLVAFSRTVGGGLIPRQAGQVVLMHRRPESVLFSWRLGERSGTSAFDYLAGHCEAGALGATGTWFDPSDAGFGVSLQDAHNRLAGVFYFYDRLGAPRWVYLDFPDREGEADVWLFSGGACPGCAHRPAVPSVIGTTTLVLGATTLALAVDVAGSGAARSLIWQSENVMVRIPSAPSCEG